MSVATVTDLATRPAVRRAPAPRSTGLLRPAPSAAPDRSVTVTVLVGPGDENDGVLAALRELIAAAGAEPQAVVDVAPATGTGIEVRPDIRVATRDGETLALSRLEYDLLLFLAENPRRVFSRTQLLNQVWGHTHTSVRTVDVHVSRLRTKLGESPDLITTVYGIGYRLADDATVTVVR